MIRNRWFKGTLGVPAEVIIANSFDSSNANGAVVTAVPSTVNATATIIGTPVAGDQLGYIVDGIQYIYLVKAGDTPALVVAGVQALLATNTQGFTSVATGTTSAQWALSANGTTFNGKIVSAYKTGTTASAAAGGTFAGGVNAQSARQPDFASFVANAVAGALGIFWDDRTKLALNPGDTSLPANRNRKFFYGWKQGTGVTYTSTSYPAGSVTYSTSNYSAGTNDVWTLTYGGTYAAGQQVFVRIIDKTSVTVPYAQYSYSVTSTGTLATDLTALAALINAETNDAVATATATATTLIITANDKYKMLGVSGYIETTVAQPTDASNITQAHTAKGVQPVGDYASIKELEHYFWVMNGIVPTPWNGVTLEEMGLPATNVVTTTNYGIVIMSTMKEERGEVRNYAAKSYTFLAVADGMVATLASY